MGRLAPLPRQVAMRADGGGKVARTIRVCSVTRGSKKIWDTCADENNELPEHFRSIVRLLIVCGQRRGETCIAPAQLHRTGPMHDLPTGTSDKERARAPLSHRCPGCGTLFDDPGARERLRAHLSRARECKRTVLRMVQEQVKVGRALRRQRMDAARHSKNHSR